jgi:peptidoglycan hydrolase CwlO-like protein
MEGRLKMVIVHTAIANVVAQHRIVMQALEENKDETEKRLQSVERSLEEGQVHDGMDAQSKLAVLERIIRHKEDVFEEIKQDMEELGFRFDEFESGKAAARAVREETAKAFEAVFGCRIRAADV